MKFQKQILFLENTGQCTRLLYFSHQRAAKALAPENTCSMDVDEDSDRMWTSSIAGYCSMGVKRHLHAVDFISRQPFRNQNIDSIRLLK